MKKESFVIPKKPEEEIQNFVLEVFSYFYRNSRRRVCYTIYGQVRSRFFLFDVLAIASEIKKASEEE